MRDPKESWQASKLSRGYISDYKPFQMVDGEGVRCSLYVSGCLFACEGCFNAATWSFRNGEPYTKELEKIILEDLAQPYVQGLTFLGGEPMLNTPVCLSLAHALRNRFGDSKDIWTWTGYTLERLLEDKHPDKLELLGLSDVLVDGPFVLAKKDLTLAFRGSSNQRLLDAKLSLTLGEAVSWAGVSADN